MLEVTREYFGLNPGQMYHGIQATHAQAVDILTSKNIKYLDLRSALAPRVDRVEAAFLFDSECISSDWYGYEVANSIIPLFAPESTHSILCGDLIGDDQELIRSLLRESLIPARSYNFKHGTLLYCVYLNNLSDAAVQRFHDELSKTPAYLGYMPMEYASPAKFYLSTILVNAYVKHRKQIVLPHEDDRPNSENANLIDYPFAKYSYRLSSLQSMYFDLFLSYKIERPVLPGFTVDTEMSLNAVSENVLPIDDFSILLSDDKFNYLMREKRGKLEKAGIASVTRNGLSQLIQEKINGSYIYNMTHLADHDVTKFNVIIELPRTDGGHPTRMLASLEYQPNQKQLRVITLH
ncbi:hypothetical protein F0M18_16450 [Pseudohalioglobus sediminis]|uniref:Uncharacterized protein n=1 Tax=Pseudohalioglobus sediminis TaxID=2606449 RepID=A0A5B0WSR0_9GAMM|nr:hypothetical protein [Pseudohalioglobus sediminis]KAA1189261.1 hypothetical protein F0M18_16450 [Pseudohalioglobus sediminis]